MENKKMYNTIEEIIEYFNTIENFYAIEIRYGMQWDKYIAIDYKENEIGNAYLIK